MPRKTRVQLPGIPRHVIQRCNDREPCFYSDENYRRYLAELQLAAKRNHCAVHAYVLMTDHVHLLLTPFVENGLSRTMQDLGRQYVRHINRTRRRSGALWAERYKASLVDSKDYLLTCMRYIELIPVRVRKVSRPEDYPWSSYHANARGEADPLIRHHPAYQVLGSTAANCQHAYRGLFREHPDDHLLHSIHIALDQGLALGGAGFEDRIEQLSRRRARPDEDGRLRIDDAPDACYL